MDSPNPAIEQFVQKETSAIMEYVSRVLGNSRLLSELGFAGDVSSSDVVTLIVLGDGIHPIHGPRFMRESYTSLSDSDFLALVEARDREVETMVCKTLELLRTQGSSAATKFAEKASPHQVLSLTNTEHDLRAALFQFAKDGYGLHELSDDRLEKCGKYLLIGYSENLSYFLESE